MLLTPLFLAALNLNQFATDRIFHYRPCFYWDKENQKFLFESRQRKMILWKFYNFGIICCVGLPSCLFVFMHAIYEGHSYTILQFLAAAMELCFAVVIPLTAWQFLKHDEIICFLNEAAAFENHLSKKCSNIQEIPRKPLMTKFNSLLHALLGKHSGKIVFKK